jgi:hypothetical protein
MFNGPSAFNLNLGVRKITAITERVRLELRAESINVTNKVNWLVNDQYLQNPDPTTGKAVFADNGGLVTQWTPPRSLQFSVRLLF